MARMSQTRKGWLYGFLSRCLHPGRYLERRYNIKAVKGYDTYVLFDKKRNPLGYECINHRGLEGVIKPIRGTNGRYRIDIKSILSRRKNDPVKKMYIRIREEKKQHGN